MASGLLPKLPVISSLCDEVPHIFIPISHLEPREFLVSSAKRLLQQYRHKADIRGTATIWSLLDKSGHWLSKHLIGFRRDRRARRSFRFAAQRCQPPSRSGQC